MKHPTEFQVSLFVDGDLPSAKGRELEEHFDVCDSCREYLEFLRELKAVARELDAPEPPDIADEVIRRRIATGSA